MAEKSLEEDPNVLMLGYYPFYINGPPKDIVKEVFEKTKKKLEDLLGDKVVSIERMGSSSVDGLAGTPVVDIIMAVKGWPLGDEDIKGMEGIGYEYRGTALHDKDDRWFHGGEGEPGHLGRVVIHTTAPDATFFKTMQSFNEYLATHPAEVQKYSETKVMHAKEAVSLPKDTKPGPFSTYKIKKNGLALQILEDARRWAAERQGGGNAAL